MTVWVLVALPCDGCGGWESRRIRAFSKKPTEKEVYDMKSDMGGMWCISADVSEVEVDGEASS